MTFLDASLPGRVARRTKARRGGLLLSALLLAACSKATESATDSETSMSTSFGTMTGNTAQESDSNTDTDTDSGSDSDTDSNSESDSDTSSDTTTGTGEPPPLDAGNALPSCDPWAQDCREGEKCTWLSVDDIHEAICVPLAPEPAPAGEPCQVLGDPGSGNDDCALGSLCGWLDEEGQGVCLPLCTGDPEQPSCPETEPASICQPCPSCPSLCAQTCNPLSDECGPGLACKPNAGTFTCTPEQNLGPGGFGDPCQYSAQCQADYACIDGALVPGCDGPGCCSPLCEVDAPECPAQLDCVIWAGEVPPGPSVGVCMAS